MRRVHLRNIVDEKETKAPGYQGPFLFAATAALTIICHGATDVLVDNVRVELCRRHPGVSEGLLDDAEVGSLPEHIRGAGMAQYMGRHLSTVEARGRDVEVHPRPQEARFLERCTYT